MLRVCLRMDSGVKPIALVLFCLFSLAPEANPQEPKQYSINLTPKQAAKRDGYYVSLFKLALEKTQDTYGAFELTIHNEPIEQRRTISHLKEGKFIDAIWTMTSIQREREMLPVRIPLLKGIMGYRIAIIRELDKGKFRNIVTRNALLSQRLGQVEDWPDTGILKQNGLNVVTTSKYENLFKMLHHGRFELFPRAMHEPFSEVASRPDLQLTVDTDLLIKYRTAIYFFVNKHNTHLAHRLESGLMKAIEDGSFNTLFEQHMKPVFEIANIHQRNLIELENPTLPADTPVNNPKLWY